MRSESTSAGPAVSPWAQLVALFGTFAAGGFIGWGLSSWAAPGSGLGAAVSGVLLPAAFAAGLVAWAGVYFLSALRDLVRGRARAVADPDVRGSRWFIPLSLATSSAGGLIVGLLPGGEGPLLSMLAYAAAGGAYGAALRRLATRGYLPAPHSF